MKYKILTLTIIFIGFLAATTATPTTTTTQITPSTPPQLKTNNTISMKPGKRKELEYNIVPGTNNTVSLVKDNIKNFSLSQPLGAKSTFTSSGKLKIYISSPNTPKLSDTGKLTFSITHTNNGSTSHSTKTVNFTAKTIIPYNTLKPTPIWINKTFQLQINGKVFNVSNKHPQGISQNGDLYLKEKVNNTVEIKNHQSKTINGVRITDMEAVPNHYVKIKAQSKHPSNTTFKVKHLSKKKNTQCKLGISTKGGTILRRGRLFVFKTINANNGNQVNNVDYQLQKTVGSGEVISSGTTSSNFATGQVSIPKTLYKKNPQVQKVLLKLMKKGSNCKPTSRTIKLNTPYGQYIQGKPGYHLKLKKVNNTVYTNITGLVVNGKGKKVGSGTLNIVKPNGKKTDITFNKTGFSFKPKKKGTYKIQATETGYVPTKQFNVKYIPDSDGDGVPNSRDKCPHTPGVKANNGCPKINARFQVKDYKTGKYPKNGFNKNEKISIKLVNKNGSKINYNGQVKLQGSNQKINFTNGKAYTEFSNPGRYTLQLNNSVIKPTSESLKINKPKNNHILLIIGGIIVVLIIAGGYTYFKNNGDGSNTTSDRKINGPNKIPATTSDIEFNINGLDNNGGD